MSTKKKIADIDKAIEALSAVLSCVFVMGR